MPQGSPQAVVDQGVIASAQAFLLPMFYRQLVDVEPVGEEFRLALLGKRVLPLPIGFLTFAFDQTWCAQKGFDLFYGDFFVRWHLILLTGALGPALAIDPPCRITSRRGQYFAHLHHA